MRDTGYECGTCGRELDDRDLRAGVCPVCSDSRLWTWKTLPGQLDQLPIGSTLQVFSKRRWDETFDRTLFLWTSIERDAAGKVVWRSAIGRTSFADSLGVERSVYVQRYAETRFHDPLRMTSDAVTHFTCGEMTYGAWYVLHDVTPTTRSLAVRRLMEDMPFLRRAA